MKDIERKLNAAVRGTNNVSPLILENVMSRIQAEPIPEQEVKKAKNKLPFRRAFGATVSSFAVVVLCVVSILITIALNVKSYSPAPDNSNDPTHGDSDAAMPSLEDFEQTEIKESFADYCEKNDLSLLKIHGDCDFYLLSADDMPDVYKSVYEKDGLTVTIIQSTARVFLSDIQNAISDSVLRLFYNCDLLSDLTLKFAIYENKTQLISVAYYDDGSVVFVTIDYPVGSEDSGNVDKYLPDMEDVIDDISANYDY